MDDGRWTRSGGVFDEARALSIDGYAVCTYISILYIYTYMIYDIYRCIYMHTYIHRYAYTDTPHYIVSENEDEDEIRVSQGII